MLAIENIGCLVSGDDASAWLNNAAIVIDGECIVWAGNNSPPSQFIIDQRIDAQGMVVMPGLIDCHSHAIFAGTRADEFARRMNNESYQSIMAHGGGIMSTVQKTRAASDDALLALLRMRADAILAQGVTTLEIKSGYGLSLSDEIRLLRVIKQLAHEHALDIHPTLLGAHIVPAEYKNSSDKYVKIISEEMIPCVAQEKLALDCDVFCESGAFSIDAARKILRCALAHGLGLRAHVQQLGFSGGIELVRDLPIKSVSHADFLSDSDISLLAQKKTVVEALPVAGLFLRSEKITPVRALTAAGISVAIATDFNPGSAMCHDLIMAARLAVTYYGFSIHDAIRAITTNAALALGRRDIGNLESGSLADVVITNCKTAAEIFYDWTKHPVHCVIKRGKLVSSEIIR